MTEKNPKAAVFAQTFDHLVNAVEQAVVGKKRVVEMAFTTFLSGGHLLLEDVPGTGKTLLAKAMAASIAATSARIQFTPDLLPREVTGSNVFNQQTTKFEFKPGPVFHQIVLADEINRASPKTQSALLEPMEEGAVTVDGKRHELESPFMVIATQNPIEHGGTYRLPEAQLDRFLMRTELGYPERDVSIDLLGEAGIRDRSRVITDPVIGPQAVESMIRFANESVHVDRAVLGYAHDIVEATRDAKAVHVGASTRGGMSLVRAAKTWAASRGRTTVFTDDIKNLAQPVLAHRLVLDPDAEYSGITGAQVIDEVLNSVRVPEVRGGG